MKSVGLCRAFWGDDERSHSATDPRLLGASGSRLMSAATPPAAPRARCDPQPLAARAMARLSWSPPTRSCAKARAWWWARRVTL